MLDEVQVTERLSRLNECHISRRLNELHLQWFRAFGWRVFKLASIDRLVDETGKLVVIEVKRDDTGADVHWQAIKYAGYLHRATSESIIKMTAAYWKESEEQAGLRLLQHLGADDLGSLNHGQRIIIASHRFAPAVTSAALWLNEQSLEDDLFTCVKLTPYQDTETSALYIQASTIIPVPGIDEGYIVGVGPSPQPGIGQTSNNFAANLRRAYALNKDDEVTHFLQDVGRMVIEGLDPVIRPDKVSRWGGGYPSMRYYHFWYKRPPWGNWSVSYRIHLVPQKEGGQWRAEAVFAWWDGLKDLLNDIVIHPEQQLKSNQVYVGIGTDALNADFGGRIAETMRNIIARITPVVDESVGGGNEDEA